MAVQTVVVVGASLAGLRATEALRRDGFDGRIVLMGAEPHLPYDRPPLSKQLLAGEWEAQELVLRRAPYDELEIDLRLGVRATALDAATKVVTLDTGAREELAFDGALLATGATPRTLPDTPDLDGIFVLRTVDDALDLRARLDDHPRVVVVGAGFIGSEVAATCRGRGLQVTVLEALPAPLVRGLGAMLGMVCGELHRDHGVDLRLGVGVAAIEGDGRVERVRLDDGCAVDADVVVVGVGVVPVTDWLEGSGLTLDNGVVCDETLLAAPGIVAAGDVARWPNPMFDGEVMRLEHWTNAAEQGVAAARRLLVPDDGEARAVRAGAVRLVGPVRPQDPDRRPLPWRRRDAGRPRHARGASLRRGVRSGRSTGRRPRIFHARQGHAVSEDDRGAGSFEDALEHARAS